MRDAVTIRYCYRACSHSLDCCLRQALMPLTTCQWTFDRRPRPARPGQDRAVEARHEPPEGVSFDEDVEQFKKEDRDDGA
ncbi:MAG: hypothetical protein ACKVHO_12450 [Verrucomicrobiia bacterium]